MEKLFNFVYITTNLINNKQYVGSHATNNIEDGYIGSGRYFIKAINKYGYKNFKREILQQCENILEARKLEATYIIKFDTMMPNGYNLAPMGGLGFNGARLSEYTKQKISESNKGKIRTEEMRKNISNAAKGKQLGEKHPFFGKHHSEESLEKIKAKRKLQPEPMLGKHHSEKSKKQISAALTGKPLDKDHKETLRQASLNVKKIICEHCQKEFTPWGLKNHQKALNRNKQNKI